MSKEARLLWLHRDYVFFHYGNFATQLRLGFCVIKHRILLISDTFSDWYQIYDFKTNSSRDNIFTYRKAEQNAIH